MLLSKGVARENLLGGGIPRIWKVWWVLQTFDFKAIFVSFKIFLIFPFFSSVLSVYCPLRPPPLQEW